MTPFLSSVSELFACFTWQEPKNPHISLSTLVFIVQKNNSLLGSSSRDPLLKPRKFTSALCSRARDGRVGVHTVAPQMPPPLWGIPGLGKAFFVCPWWQFSLLLGAWRITCVVSVRACLPSPSVSLYLFLLVEKCILGLSPFLPTSWLCIPLEQ